MTLKIPLYLAACLTLGASPIALAASVSSTDEARVMAGASLPLSPACPEPPTAQVPSSSDEARALAAGAIEAAPPAPSSDRAPELVSGTDDARAAAAAALDEAPPARLACAESGPGGNG